MVSKQFNYKYFLVLVFAVLAGMFHNGNEIFYYLFFFLMLYFLIKSKNKIVTIVSSFLLLFISMYWTHNVIGIKFFIPFLGIYFFYTIYFLLLVFLKGKYSLLLILFLPFIEFIFIKMDIFPPILISYPINGLFFNKFTIGFYGVSLIFSFLIFILRNSRHGLYYALITLVILLLIPIRHFPQNNLKIIKPKIDRGVSVVKYLNSLKGYDGVILPEYFFRRDFQKDEKIIRELFKDYFRNNGFLAFGFTKNDHGRIESWASIMTKDNALFVRKKHPVLFLEPKYNKIKKQKHIFIYKGYRLKLFVCQDIYFPDVQSRIKNSDILIAPTYIPMIWHLKGKIYINTCSF